MFIEITIALVCFHFVGNYDCVQADGSTFFIMAPNATNEEHAINVTFLPTENMPSATANNSDDHSKYNF